MSTSTMSIEELEPLAKQLDKLRQDLQARLQTCGDELRVVARRHDEKIRRALELVAQARTELLERVAEAPELFVRPRSFVTNGVRFGFQKEKGSLVWDDTARVIERAEEFLSQEQYDFVVQQQLSLVKPALQQLSAQELRKIGVRLEGAGDVAYVKFVGSNLERWAEGMLAAMSDEKLLVE